MRRYQLLSHRAHTSTAAPSSWRRGVSHRPREGFSSSSKAGPWPPRAPRRRACSRGRSGAPATTLRGRPARCDDNAASPREGSGFARGNPYGTGYHRRMSRSRRPRPGRTPAPAVPPPSPAAAERGRRVVLVLVVLAVVLVASGIAAGGAVLAFGSKCDLVALRPAHIGQNTLVYAADGSLLLGVIPAERNRQVVPARADLALAHAGDGRDRGPPLLRARWASTPRASPARSGGT